MRMRSKEHYERFFSAHYNYYFPHASARYIEDVQCPGVKSWSAALWMYMTPQKMHSDLSNPPTYNHRVSVHEIAAGMPNEGEFASFGASIFLMNQDYENDSLDSVLCDGNVSS